MPIFIRLALLLDLTAIGIERVAPSTTPQLPLGGDHFVQLGLLLLFGAIATEGWSMAKPHVINLLQLSIKGIVQLVRAIATLFRGH